MTLLALADREGFVYGSRNGLQRAANIDWKPPERDPWAALMAPDPDSTDLTRNPENEGRRIEEVDGGFRILNFLYYRSLRNSDDRRESNRESQRRFRERVKQGKTVSPRKPRSAKVSQSVPISDAEHHKEKKSTKEKKFPIPPILAELQGFTEEWEFFLQNRAAKGAKATDHAQDLILRKLTERPRDAIAGLQMAIIQNWTGFQWEWYDRQKTIMPRKSFFKEKAPVYPKLPDHREPTEEELAKHREIVKQHVDQLRKQFRMPDDA